MIDASNIHYKRHVHMLICQDNKLGQQELTIHTKLCRLTVAVDLVGERPMRIISLDQPDYISGSPASDQPELASSRTSNRASCGYEVTGMLLGSRFVVWACSLLGLVVIYARFFALV